MKGRSLKPKVAAHGRRCTSHTAVKERSAPSPTSQTVPASALAQLAQLFKAAVTSWPWRAQAFGASTPSLVRTGHLSAKDAGFGLSFFRSLAACASPQPTSRLKITFSEMKTDEGHNLRNLKADLLHRLLTCLPGGKDLEFREGKKKMARAPASRKSVIRVNEPPPQPGQPVYAASPTRAADENVYGKAHAPVDADRKK